MKKPAFCSAAVLTAPLFLLNDKYYLSTSKIRNAFDIIRETCVPYVTYYWKYMYTVYFHCQFK